LTSHSAQVHHEPYQAQQQDGFEAEIVQEATKIVKERKVAQEEEKKRQAEIVRLAEIEHAKEEEKRQQELMEIENLEKKLAEQQRELQKKKMKLQGNNNNNNNNLLEPAQNYDEGEVNAILQYVPIDLFDNQQVEVEAAPNDIIIPGPGDIIIDENNEGYENGKLFYIVIDEQNLIIF
jgi:hypothetical protein